MENRTIINYTEELNIEKINKEYLEASKLGDKLVRGEFVDMEEFSYKDDILSTSIDALNALNASEEAIAVNKIYRVANMYLWKLASLYREERALEDTQFSRMWKNACMRIKRAMNVAMNGDVQAAFKDLALSEKKVDRQYYPACYYC